MPVDEPTERRTDIFTTFDADENDLLSDEEYDLFDAARVNDMETMAAENGGPGGGGMIGYSRSMERAVSDLDGDGRVTRAEFVDGTSVWFTLRDGDRDGVITVKGVGRPGHDRRNVFRRTVHENRWVKVQETRSVSPTAPSASTAASTSRFSASSSRSMPTAASSSCASTVTRSAGASGRFPKATGYPGRAPLPPPAPAARSPRRPGSPPALSTRSATSTPPTAPPTWAVTCFAPPACRPAPPDASTAGPGGFGFGDPRSGFSFGF